MLMHVVTLMLREVRELPKMRRITHELLHVLYRANDYSDPIKNVESKLIPGEMAGHSSVLA